MDWTDWAKWSGVGFLAYYLVSRWRVPVFPPGPTGPASYCAKTNAAVNAL